MGRYHEAFWEPDPTQLSRRGRRGGPYKWYEPTRLSELDLALSGDVVSDVLRAEDALATRRGGSATNTEGIARLLLRADAVASSKIEGLSIGARRLARAELHEFDPTNIRSDWRAAAVLGNIHAMERGVRMAGEVEVAHDELVADLGVSRGLVLAEELARAVFVPGRLALWRTVERAVAGPLGTRLRGLARSARLLGLLGCDVWCVRGLLRVRGAGARHSARPFAWRGAAYGRPPRC